MTGRIRGVLFAALAALFTLGAGVGVGASAASASSPAEPAAAQATSDVTAFMTLYGYADNSPPGTDIAHPCIHSQAGGTGTYADPITFATDVAELGWCQIIYVPYMERYFIHEDECSQCDTTWNSLHLYRFDMWAGGNASSLTQPGRSALLGCESTWTRGNSPTDPNNPSIEVDPPSNLPVVTTPIFTPPTTCWTPITGHRPGQPAILHRLPGESAGGGVGHHRRSDAGLPRDRPAGGARDQRIDRPDLGRSDAEGSIEGHGHRVRHLRLGHGQVPLEGEDAPGSAALSARRCIVRGGGPTAPK